MLIPKFDIQLAIDFQKSDLDSESAAIGVDAKNQNPDDKVVLEQMKKAESRID